MSYFAVF